MPSFNTLNLFEVNEQSFHMVTKVAPTALEKRLTVNGWWRSENIISHKPSFKQKKNNETITLYAGLGKKRA
jgi:Rps23 Pro-64 3,4-dihydroxylase Tpa1-like proline 4-hydroxylase